MRVVLSGTNRSGKTTLLEAFRGIPEVIVVEEVARSLIAAEGRDIIKRPDFQDMLFAEQTRREQEALKQILGDGPEQVCVMDRTVADNIVYSFVLAEREPDKEFPINPEWLDYIAGTPNDLIFLCDPRDVPYDESMSTSWKENGTYWRKRLHDVYQLIYPLLGLRYRLLSGNVQSRVAQVDSTLEMTGIRIMREGTRGHPEK